jgi:hypothetical protein
MIFDRFDLEAKADGPATEAELRPGNPRTIGFEPGHWGWWSVEDGTRAVVAVANKMARIVWAWTLGKPFRLVPLAIQND